MLHALFRTAFICYIWRYQLFSHLVDHCYRACSCSLATVDDVYGQLWPMLSGMFLHQAARSVVTKSPRKRSESQGSPKPLVPSLSTVL